MTGVGTPRSSAVSRVHLPSPEECMTPRMASEMRVFCECVGGKFHQPGTHHRAMVPKLGNLLKIKIIVRFFQHLESFRNGLHHAVFDAVVHHFGQNARRRARRRNGCLRARKGRQKWACSIRTPRVRRRSWCRRHSKRRKCHRKYRNQENQFLWLSVLIASYGVVEIGIAAIDHEYRPGEGRVQAGFDHLIYNRPGGHHQPDNTRPVSAAQTSSARELAVESLFRLPNLAG